MARSRKAARSAHAAVAYAPRKTTLLAPAAGSQVLGRIASLAAVAIASGVSLAFEVLLTRLFSVLFQYHYVFVATSVAITGLGLGAALGAWLLADRPFTQTTRITSYSMVALGVLLTVDSILFARLPWVSSVHLHALLALPVFMLIGTLMAFIFANRARESAQLYAADLGGAAFGAVAVLPLIASLGAFATIQVLAILALGAGLLLASTTRNRTGMIRASIFLAIALLLLVVQRTTSFFDLDTGAMRGAAPDKTMLRVLHDPALQGRIVETVWGQFARLDVVETNDPAQKLVFTDGGAGSYMIRLQDGLAEAALLKQSAEYLPFIMGTNEDVLVLGAGAGKDVVLALLADSKHITAVEINQDMVDLTRRYRNYNGNILDHPQVNTVVADGRTFVERDTSQYDLIYLNVVYSQAAGHEGAALAESYIFTEEAMRSYWKRLKTGGRIGIITHNTLEGSRVMLTAIAAMQAEGMSMRQALDRVALAMVSSDDPVARQSVLLITKQLMADDVLDAFGANAGLRGMQPVYTPARFEVALRDLVLGRNTVYEFARNGDYNLVPASDDRPFFYHLDWGIPAPLSGLLYIIPCLVVLYAGVVVYSSRQTGTASMVALTIYFVMLGVAFMLVLLPLVQRYYLLAGNPILAFVTTLVSLLVGAGLGSLISSRIQTRLPVLAALAAAGVALLIIIQVVTFSWVRDQLLLTSLATRLGAIVALTFPIGFCLGIPFPTGLRILTRYGSRYVPLFWGLNALAAVLGSLVATLLSLSYGFQTTLYIAAILYMFSALLVITSARHSSAAG